MFFFYPKILKQKSSFGQRQSQRLESQIYQFDYCSILEVNMKETFDIRSKYERNV